jgi:hypothetical protein
MHLRQNLTPMLNKLRHAIHMFKVVAVDRSKLTWRVKEVGGSWSAFPQLGWALRRAVYAGKHLVVA